jgi:hypothetical protein
MQVVVGRRSARRAAEFINKSRGHWRHKHRRILFSGFARDGRRVAFVSTFLGAGTGR